MRTISIASFIDAMNPCVVPFSSKLGHVIWAELPQVLIKPAQGRRKSKEGGSSLFEHGVPTLVNCQYLPQRHMAILNRILALTVLGQATVSRDGEGIGPWYTTFQPKGKVTQHLLCTTNKILMNSKSFPV